MIIERVTQVIKKDVQRVTYTDFSEMNSDRVHMQEKGYEEISMFPLQAGGVQCIFEKVISVEEIKG
jgi:hypothetical protein